MVYVLVALVGALAALWLSRQWRTFGMRRRFRRAREGELDALALLRTRGYAVLDEQVRRKALMWVDRRAVEYDVRADYLVSRRWRTYVVEVKTGKIAPDPKSAATRRQLLEYGVVYDVDGLILADMSAGELHEIRFPGPIVRPGGLRIAMMALMIGAIAGALALRFVDTLLQ